MIKYKVEIDILRNGEFNHELSDITNRVRDSLTFTTGYNNPDQIPTNPSALVAPTNLLQLTLDNRDGAFNYESQGSNGIIGAAFYNLLSQSIMIRFSMTLDGVTHSYTFYTVSMRTSVGQYGDQIALLTAQDATPRLQAVRYEPEVEQNKRTSDAITDFFKNSEIYLPYSSDFFILDISKINPPIGIASIINPSDTINRVLYDADTFIDEFLETETGIGVLDYVGDNLRTPVDDKLLLQNGLAYVYDICMGEAFGRLYFNPRDNKFHFQNRHHDANTNPELTLTTSDVIALATRQSVVSNDVRIFYTPREVGEAGTVLFEAQNLPITIGPESRETIGVQFRNPDNKDNIQSALTTIDPVINTDVIVTSSGGANITKAAYVGADLNATGGEIFFRNPTGNDYTITKLQVRGTPIYQHDQEYAQAVDAKSIFFNNHAPLPDVRIAYAFDKRFVQGVADYLVRQYAPMRRVADSVTVMLREDNFIEIMGLDLGDAVTITDPDANHTNDYIIMGERHELDIPNGAHRLTFILRTKDVTAYFILDRDILDSNEIILGY
jgi:hypothetical protein